MLGGPGVLTRVYLGLGSNLGDRVRILREAVQALRASPGIGVVAVSPLYETEAWEREPGSRAETYLNAAVAVDTTLSAPELLARTQAVETALGRTRPAPTPEVGRFEPRPIDVDLLLFGDLVLAAGPDLQVPHPLLHERAFALRPLADLAPEVEHPALYRTVRDLLEAVDDAHEVRPADAPRDWAGD